MIRVFDSRRDRGRRLASREETQNFMAVPYFFDTLIALSARDSGAILVTCNREDFVEIGKYVAFRAVYW